VQHFRSYFLIGVEVTIKRCKTDFKPLLFEDVGKAALWQTSVKRHLAAFEADLARITRTRLLTFLAASSGLPEA
jgi:hypothetical protein